VSLIIDEHRVYLSDKHRLAAFVRAVSSVVKSGQTVLDLASGTGTVVNPCDGVRTLTEIEDEVFRLHPHLFRNREEASLFVAEVVTRYAE
jgi:predicted RNA methylase